MAEDLPAPFGKYFLTEKLATGGMAEIYLAKLIGPGGFEKPLVIKQIHPRLTGQRQFVDLFVAEAKTLVTLAHGNIVPVYELGVIDDTYFIAMEYIDGPTLYRLTEALARREAVMQPAVAAWIVARIVEGLDYAHRKGEGVIHRDLSPRNVMLSRDGEVKLVDFGIAVTLGDAAEGDHSSAPTGSFPYMSPEQVRKEPLTGQTDLFSVGVLAWEMLTGQRLFARGDAEATLAAVEGADIALPSSVRPDIPSKLDEVVMRALDRDVASRWATAGDMLAAINKYLYALDETPGPRDVAALVARYCPPETRRLPTHAEALVNAQADDELPAPEAPAPSGPRTAVIPRDGAPRGKQRAPTRQQSFATHVELKDIFERATPMFGVTALVDDQAQTHVSSPRAEVEVAAVEIASDDDANDASRSGMRRARSTRVDDTGADVDAAATHDPRLPDARVPSGSMLGLASIAALILGAAAFYVFLHGRAAVLAPDAAPKYDVARWAIFSDATPAAADDASAIAIDAQALDATPEALADAGVKPPPAHADAAIAVAHADAHAAPVPADDAAIAVTGTATLGVGAIPWGDVAIDGAHQHERAPSRFTVSAGHHVVVVTYTGEDTPKTRTFPVDLLPGETHEIDADFTKP